MKSNRKSKITILIILGIFFPFSSIISSNLNLKNSEFSKSIYLDNENLKISVVSAPIHIDGNSGWAAFKAAGNCTGDGTYSNPYIITNLEIDGGGSGSCILIENSDVYFRIENCKLYNAGGYPKAGIELNNVTKGILVINNCTSSFYGIKLDDSDNNTISRNTANNNSYGIYLEGSNNNFISDNIVSYNNAVGVFIWDGASFNNLISGNIMDNNTNGVVLSGCGYNNITENIISRSGNVGLALELGPTHSPSYRNNIFLNCFNNTNNAVDYGSNNNWDNGVKGNYWADYAGLDANNDGIGDIPYDINGSAGSKDYFPLMKCPLTPPQEDGRIPLELIILISVISGGAAIGVATMLLIRRKRKRIE
ncbi:MAG: nitrous oxide reductase family maturation protein NosD [Promethearchaeota archaeon]